MFAIFVKISTLQRTPFVMKFEYSPNPWQIFATFAIFAWFVTAVRFAIYVSFATLEGAPLAIFFASFAVFVKVITLQGALFGIQSEYSPNRWKIFDGLPFSSISLPHKCSHDSPFSHWVHFWTYVGLWKQNQPINQCQMFNTRADNPRYQPLTVKEGHKCHKL